MYEVCSNVLGGCHGRDLYLTYSEGCRLVMDMTCAGLSTAVDHSSDSIVKVAVYCLVAVIPCGLRSFETSTPLKSMWTPAEIANCSVFLCDTWATWVIDGGVVLL